MYDALMLIEPNRQLHNDVITLFGGEPLLRANKGLVGELINKGCEQGYKFTATTNGYDLDQYAEFLGEEPISRLLFLTSLRWIIGITGK